MYFTFHLLVAPSKVHANLQAEYLNAIRSLDFPCLTSSAPGGRKKCQIASFGDESSGWSFKVSKKL